MKKEVIDWRIVIAVVVILLALVIWSNYKGGINLGPPGISVGTYCGDGNIIPPETCDDAHWNGFINPCLTIHPQTGTACQLNTCGDGSWCQAQDTSIAGRPGLIIECVDGIENPGSGLLPGSEGCDDGNFLPGDGCNPRCRKEEGYTCYLGSGGRSVCTADVFQ